MLSSIKQTERELRIRNFSPKTLKSYLYGLREYFTFKKIDLAVLDIDNVKNYVP